MSEDKKFWFDYTYKRIKACHRLVNFVVGARGCGKTFAFKEDAVSSFLKDGSQFVYMRRYEKELMEAKARELFFPLDLRKKYAEHELVYRNGYYMIDGKPAGFPFPLSTSGEMKSIEYDNVTNICFDEFIIKGGSGYLPNEMFLFNEALVTIGRMRAPQFFLMSNNISWQNPYFTRYKIPRLEKGKELYLAKRYTLCKPKSEKYKKAVAESPVGAFLKEMDPDYFDYAFDNETHDETNDFIADRPKNTRYLCTINFDNDTVGIWLDNAGLLYASLKTDPSALITFNCSRADLKKSRLNFKRGGIFDRIQSAYLSDRLFYEDQTAKGIVTELMRFVLY